MKNAAGKFICVDGHKRTQEEIDEEEENMRMCADMIADFFK